MNEPGPRFNGDDELDYLLAQDGDARPELTRMVEADEQRALWRFGRALSRLAAQDEDMARYLRMISEEVALERGRIQRRMADLESIFEAAALAQREDLKIKSLKVPGVGTWQTRSVPASWRTEDEESAVRALQHEHPDEFQLFTEAHAFVALRKDDLKGWLDEQGLTEFPGMAHTPERVSVKSPFSA